MKKIISILALVLAMTMLMSVAAFAAPEFSVAEEDIDAKITALEAGADRIDLTAVTTPDADYSILLVKGDSLPTVDSDIAYINQIKAEAATTDFDVLPLIANCDEEMMLYIGTNATGENLISIPVTYAEPAADGPNVTLMNGATAVEAELVIDEDGNVILPATADFGKTSPAGYTFALYSWVTEDGATEHLADAKVAAADLEGKTLYAKFATTRLRGDFNENGAIDSTDMNPIQFKVKGLLPAMQKNAGLAIYEGSSILKGDFNGNGAIDSTDMNPIQFKVKGLLPAMQKDVDKPYYVINK